MYLSDSVGLNGKNLKNDLNTIEKKFKSLNFYFPLTKNIRFYQTIINGLSIYSTNDKKINGRIDPNDITLKWLSSRNSPAWINIRETDSIKLILKNVRMFTVSWYFDIFKKKINEYYLKSKKSILIYTKQRATNFTEDFAKIYIIINKTQDKYNYDLIVNKLEKDFHLIKENKFITLNGLKKYPILN